MAGVTAADVCTWRQILNYTI